MKSYDRANPEVYDRIAWLLDNIEYHEELKTVEVKVDCIFVATDSEEGHALTCNGVRALAVARILNSKDRCMGRGDVEICIDRDAYEAMPDQQRYALLDHELRHFEVCKEKDGGFATDDQHRPKLKTRQHDRQYGWFDCVAKRWGQESHEVRQMRGLWEKAEDVYFPFMAEEQV